MGEIHTVEKRSELLIMVNATNPSLSYNILTNCRDFFFSLFGGFCPEEPNPCSFKPSYQCPPFLSYFTLIKVLIIPNKCIINTLCVHRVAGVGTLSCVQFNRVE